MSLSRRDFLTAAGAGSVAALVGGAWEATNAVDPVTSVDNPLKSYPNREWEQVYHDIYSHDDVASALEDAGGIDLPEHALDLRGVPDKASHDQVLAEYDALDPGEPLYAQIDTDPRPLTSVLIDQVDGPAPTVDVDRRGPDAFALRLERPPADAGEAGDCEDAHGGTSACACNGDHATHRH